MVRQVLLLVGFIVAVPIYIMPQTAQAGDPGRSVPLHTPQNEAPLLKNAQSLDIVEQDAYRLEGPMRAWGLWQVARLYPTTEKKKALQLLNSALAETAALKDVPPHKMQETLMLSTGSPVQSTRSWLQEQVARTIIMIDPGRADELLQTLDTAARDPILQALMSYYEAHKLTERAVEQFNRIAGEDEAPYAAAARIMVSLKPEQSGELAAIFYTCLRSYHVHSPHQFQPADPFPKMLVRYWQKVPRQLARDAVDEILQQAQDGNANRDFSMSFGSSGLSAGSLLEYRLAQLLPIIRELEPARTREYMEKYPTIKALAESYTSSDSPPPSSRQALAIHSDPVNLYANMAEWPVAERIASRADTGDPNEALEQAAGLRSTDLKVQAFEHIARAALKKDPSIAASAVKKMLAATEDSKLERQPAYYSSAAQIFMTLGDLDSAKSTIEKGLVSAAKLYKQDSDSDDPNTALSAFWPSTNAYCMLLQRAYFLSEAWAAKLLNEIENPEIRFAAEVAITRSAFNVPASREMTIIAKRNGFQMSLGPDSTEDSPNR